MRLLFKQRLFSWFDSYDIYNEAGETVYTVKGQLAWGHCLKIFDAGGSVATVSKQLFNWTDTYVIDVCHPQDALYALMLVLAIDAEKCSRND